MRESHDCIVFEISMACQRYLIFNYDVQDRAAGCVARWRPTIFMEMDRFADDISSNHIKLRYAESKQGNIPLSVSFISVSLSSLISAFTG